MATNPKPTITSTSDVHLLEQYLTTLPEPSALPSDRSGRADLEPEPQVLHNRAAESARETRQAIVTLASASLGIFFLALTADITPPLSAGQKVLIAIALLAMALAVFAGLWSAYADAQWSYYWAKEITKRKYYYETADVEANQAQRWHWHKRWSEQAALITFGIGVLVSAFYIAMRAFLP